MFFLKDGEVVIRKYIDLPPGVAAFNIGFYEWARKKKIEIDLTQSFRTLDFWMGDLIGLADLAPRPRRGWIWVCP